MGKYLLTKAKVLLDGADLSNWAFSLDTPEEAEQVDVSGFNPNRVREFLAGLIDQTITIGMLQDFASSKVHQTLQPLFERGDTFEVWIKPDSSQPASASNPVFGGLAQLFAYNGLSGELNARGEITVTIKPASNTAFFWRTSDPT